MMKEQPVKLTLFLLLLLLAVAGTLAWRREAVQAERAQRLRLLVEQKGLEPLAPPQAGSPALVELGRLLFFDRILSGNRDVSCATCHHPARATVDGLSLSIGTGGYGHGRDRTLGARRRFVSRNAQDLFNRGLPAWQTAFWDGRVAVNAQERYETPVGDYLPEGLDSALAAQAMFPVTQRVEMRGGTYDVASYTSEPGTTTGAEYRLSQGGWQDKDIFGQPNELAAIADGSQHAPAVWDALMERLLTIPEYEQLFRQAYPRLTREEFGFEHAANGLAAYQTQAFTFIDSPWNRYLAGDEAALSGQALAGALLFFGKAGCAGCHSPPLFTDQEYHNIGAPQFGPGHDEYAPLDYGRFHVSGEAADRYAFRTPSLLNVSLTGPWLHNGAYDSLEDVIRHHLDPAAALQRYEGEPLHPALRETVQNEPVTVDGILQTLDPHLAQPKPLSDVELASLLAFLDALADPQATDAADVVPLQVPSGLPLDR